MVRTNRLWLWVLSAVLSMTVLVLCLAWFLLPHFLPEWTLENSPFFAQKMLVVEYAEESVRDSHIEQDLFDHHLYDYRAGSKYLRGYLETLKESPDFMQFTAEAKKELIAYLESTNQRKQYQALALIWANEYYFGYRDALDSDCARAVNSAMRSLFKRDPSAAMLLMIGGWRGRPNWYNCPSVEAEILHLCHDSNRILRQIARAVAIDETPILKELKRVQRSDGAWSDDDSINGLATLLYLGNGYDHKTPSKFKTTIARAVDRFKKQEPGSYFQRGIYYPDLVIAEAYAMTMDPSLEGYVQIAAKHILEKAKGRIGKPWSRIDLELAQLHLACAAGGQLSRSSSYWNVREGGRSPVVAVTIQERIFEAVVKAYAKVTVTDAEDLFEKWMEAGSSLHDVYEGNRALSLYALNLILFKNGGQSYSRFKEYFYKEFWNLDTWDYRAADEDVSVSQRLGIYPSTTMTEDEKIRASILIGLSSSIQYRWLRMTAKKK